MPGRSDRATTKIFVGNLPDRYPDDSLRELFEQYGEVSECDVIKNFAFVHFVSEEEAESAVKGLNGAEVKGKNIRVEISEKSRGGRGGGGDSRGPSGAGGRKDAGSTKLFVGNLPDGYPDNSLRELFEQYGEVTECDVLKNFGFVHFRKQEEAEKAKDGLTNHSIEGKKIRVESSGPGRGGSSSTAGTKLFVGNLPDDFPAGELRSMFEKYGRVVECDIIKHFAFVHFDNPRDASTAKDALNNVRIKDRNIRVQVSNTGVRQKAGMGDSDGCFGCGERGHWSKECPNQGRGRSGGVGGGKDRDTCNRCGESGHWARDCPKPSDWRPRDGGRDGRDGGRRGFDDRSDFGGRGGRGDFDRGSSQIGVTLGSRDNLTTLGGRGLTSNQMAGSLAGGTPMAGVLAGGAMVSGGATMGGGMSMSGSLAGRDPYAPVRDPYGAPRPDAFGAPRPDPYGAAPRQDAFGQPRPADGYGVPQRDPYGPPRDSFRSSDPYARDSGYPPQMRDRSPLRAPPSSVPSDSYFGRRTPPRSMPPKEDSYSRMQYGAIDDRPAYGGATEQMAQYTQSSLGSSAGGGLPSRSFPMEQDRFSGQMAGGTAQMGGAAYSSGLEDMSMGNGAARAIGYPASMSTSASDARAMAFAPSSHMPSHSSADRGFPAGYGYGR